MSDKVAINAYLMIVSTDVSTYLMDHNLDLKKEQVDNTSMGMLARSAAAGLQANGYRAKLKDDAAGVVRALLTTMWSGEASTALKVRAVNTTISAANPEFQFTAKLFDFPAVSGAVGELAVFDVTFFPDSVVTIDETA